MSSRSRISALVGSFMDCYYPYNAVGHVPIAPAGKRYHLGHAFTITRLVRLVKAVAAWRCIKIKYRPKVFKGDNVSLVRTRSNEH